MKIVILAGDIGKKLWPLTREEIPKAFLPLYGQLNYLAETLLRTIPLVETPDDIFILLPEKSVESLDWSVLKINSDNILLEPKYKGNANSMAWATDYLHEFYDFPKEEILMFMPVDHFVDPLEVFLLHIYNSLEVLIEAERLITYVAEPSELKYDSPMCELDHAKARVYGESAETPLGIVSTIAAPVQQTIIKTEGVDALESHFDLTGIYTATMHLWDEIFKKYYTFPTINTKTQVVKTGWFSKEYINDYDEDDLYSKWAELKTVNFETDVLPNLVEDRLVYGCDLNSVVWYKVDSWSSIKHLLFDSGLFDLGHNPELHQVDAKNNYVFKPVDKQVALFGVDNLIIIDSNDSLLVGSSKSIDENL
jgi:hypothetical protein